MLFSIRQDRNAGHLSCRWLQEATRCVAKGIGRRNISVTSVLSTFVDVNKMDSAYARVHHVLKLMLKMFVIITVLITITTVVIIAVMAIIINVIFIIIIVMIIAMVVVIMLIVIMSICLGSR